MSPSALGQMTGIRMSGAMDLYIHVCCVLGLLTRLVYSTSLSTDKIVHVYRRDVSVIMCNADHDTWACGCSGCDLLPPSRPCCLDSVELSQLNHAVNIMVSNTTSHEFSADQERSLKSSVSGILDSYCNGYPEDCRRDIPDYSPTGLSVFSPSRVVLLEVSDVPDEDKDQDNLVMMLLVFHGSDADPINSKLIQRALLNQSSVLEAGLGWRIKFIRVMDPVADPPAPGLPVKAIIAGSVLGFILVISCVISAVKAVRDRRLIKERNALKREQKLKRHKELQDSFRKSPKKSPSHVTGNGDAPCTSYNGDVSATQEASQIVQVVVHTNYDKPPTYTDVIHDSPEHQSQVSVNNVQPEIHSDVTVPNGHVSKDPGIQSNRISASDAYISSHIDGESPVINNTYMDNNTNTDNHVTSGPEVVPNGTSRRQEERPGVVNRAYSIEEDAL